MIFRKIYLKYLYESALHNVFGFWEAAALAFVLQFIAAFVVSSLKINKITNLTNEFEAELQQLLDLSETTIVCPCNNNTFTENIFINTDNSYTCEKCNNTYRVDVNLIPTLITDIVDVNKTFADLGKDVEITSEYTEGTEL